MRTVLALCFAAALAASCRTDCATAADCDRGQRCGDRGFCTALPGAAPVSLSPGQSFQVIAVYPAPGGRAAPQNGPVMALTNRPLDAATLGGFSLEDAAGTAVAGGFDLLADPPGLLFAPRQPLAAGGAYSARLAAPIADTGGAVLSSPVAWTFTVAR